MSKSKTIELHVLFVDGKKYAEWTGGRTPAGLKRLFHLKGVEHKITTISVEGVEK